MESQIPDGIRLERSRTGSISMNRGTEKPLPWAFKLLLPLLLLFLVEWDPVMGQGRQAPGVPRFPQGPKPAARGNPREVTELKNTSFRIALGKVDGNLEPLLGINAGPTPSGEAGNADLTEQYHLAGIQEVRTQDFYGPMDMSIMFPDFRADPGATGSFDFRESDRVFSAILKAGLRPYLRVGDSYDNARIPTNQEEFSHYASAAVQVVRHFCFGAMSGFRSEPSGVEIGNEPDNERFWPGRYEDFFPFFAGVFKELKRSSPGLKVGGPGFVVSSYKIPENREKVSLFLGYLREHGIRPDFISFHLYSDDPAEYYDLVRFYRHEAARYGMEKAELHVSEWNTETGGLKVRVGPQAAPLVTACWIALQQAGLDASFLFRGTDTNIDNPGFYGIFFADGRKKPGAFAFHLWSRMAPFRDRLAVDTGEEVLDAEPEVGNPLKPVWILAARGEKGNIGMLVSNIGRQRLSFSFAEPFDRARIAVTEFGDEKRGLVELHPSAGDPVILPPFSVQFLEIVSSEIR